MQGKNKRTLKRGIFRKVREYYALCHQTKPFIPGKTRIHYSGRVYDHREIVNLVDAALEFWLTAGRYAKEFEKRMTSFFNANDFLLVNSGSSANLLMISVLMSEQLEDHIHPRDEIITPSVTFPTTLAPIVQRGLTPVLVDCELGTYNVAAQEINKAISEKTVALFIPHTLGNPCEMDRIMDIARENNLYVLEDCCDALGATFDGKLVGSFGDMASLSFYPAHHITMGEGGGVVINNPRLVKIARSVRDWGRDCWCAPGASNTCGKRFQWQLGDPPFAYDHKYVYSNLGYNLKVTDMQAAVGLAQLGKLKRFVGIRRANFAKYHKGLKKYQRFMILPIWHDKAKPSWFGFPITLRNGIKRSELIQWLEDGKIETRLMFCGNALRQPAFRNMCCRVAGSLQNSDKVMRNTFFLGVYPRINSKQIHYILQRFDQFFTR